MEKCVWCNRSERRLKNITVETPNRFGLNAEGKKMAVCPEHVPQLQKFYFLVNRMAKWYVLVLVLVGALALLGLVPLVMIDQQGGNVDSWAKAIYAPLLLPVALLPLVFPFATPETVKWMGVRNSIILVRLLGVYLLGFWAWWVLRGF